MSLIFSCNVLRCQVGAGFFFCNLKSACLVRSNLSGFQGFHAISLFRCHVGLGFHFSNL
jgi:hypothetical protein